MIGALGRWWRKRQRRIDLEILWPVCKENSETIFQARAAFTMHCYMDPAWGKDFDAIEIDRIVGRLT